MEMPIFPCRTIAARKDSPKLFKKLASFAPMNYIDEIEIQVLRVKTIMVR